MRVLVTGGAGFIGSHTVDKLVDKGYEVRVLDCLLPHVHPHRRFPNWINSKANYFYGDIRSKVDWEMALDGVDYVIHLAAYQGYFPDFSNFFATNTVGISLLYETVIHNKLPIKKIVFASSQGVYGEGAYLCNRDGEVYPPPRTEEQLKSGKWEPLCPKCKGRITLTKTNEEASILPHNSYAISTYTKEPISMVLGKRYDIPTVGMRYTAVQGPRQSFYNLYSGILRIFSLRLLNNKPPILFEDGQQIRGYASVYDIADANILALENKDADFQIFNVGGEMYTTVSDYAEMIARKLNKNIKPEISKEYRVGDTRHITPCVKKLRTLGWQPKFDLEQIVDSYVDWVKDQPEAIDSSKEADEVMRKVGTIRKVEA